MSRNRTWLERTYCDECDKETLHTVVQIAQDWQSKNPDDFTRLDETEYSNGDFVHQYTCEECGRSGEEM